MALSAQTHTGLDALMTMPMDELNEIAEAVVEYAEAVKQARGRK